MAQRRMFSLDIVDTDRFLEMPISAQNLYFHLGMRADDDGFVSSPKKIANSVNCTINDLKLLQAKNFIICFDSGVIVIKDWKINNYIQKDRYKRTRYVNEMKQLVIKENGTYELIQDMDTVCIQSADDSVYSMDTQVSIGKDSINNTYCSELSQAHEPEEQKNQKEKPTPKPVISLILNDKREYPIYQRDIDEWKEIYPNVDIDNEFRKIKGWCIANPTKRKTSKGIKKFINSWLSKEQDKGRVNTQEFNYYSKNGIREGEQCARANVNERRIEQNGFRSQNNENNGVSEGERLARIAREYTVKPEELTCDF